MIESNLTIIILTLNEEHDLPRCLNAIPSQYPIVVVDSGSTDSTIAIATKHGCSVYHNDWPGHAEQRNFALEKCGILTRWVLFVDADETFPVIFYDWFEKEIANSTTLDVVMVPSFLIFRGQQLKYAPGYPIYHARLLRIKTVRFSSNHTGGFGGENIAENCRMINANIPYNHYFYSGDLIGWMHKHVNYAATEIQSAPSGMLIITRRKRLSLLFGHSVLRIPARFFYHYLFCRGFLDGKAGLEYSLMYAWYEATKYVLGVCR